MTKATAKQATKTTPKITKTIKKSEPAKKNIDDKKVKGDKPNWDTKKIANEQWLSLVSYFTVTDI